MHSDGVSEYSPSPKGVVHLGVSYPCDGLLLCATEPYAWVYRLRTTVGGPLPQAGMPEYFDTPALNRSRSQSSCTFCVP